MQLTETDIFIVDDTPANTRMLEKLLKKEGFVRLHVYNSPKHALADIKLINPGLILLDMHMPDIDGNMFLTCIESEIKSCQLSVIVLTASQNEQTRQTALSLGAIDYIEKPINVFETISRIKNVLHSQNAKDLLTQEKRQLDNQLIQFSEEIKGIKKLLTTIFNHSSEYVFIVDKDWLVVDANERALSLFKFSIDAHVSFLDLFKTNEDEFIIEDYVASEHPQDPTQQIFWESQITDLQFHELPLTIYILKDVTERVVQQRVIQTMAEQHYITKLPNRYQLNTIFYNCIKELTDDYNIGFLMMSFYDNSLLLSQFGPKIVETSKVVCANAMSSLCKKNGVNVLQWSEDRFLFLLPSFKLDDFIAQTNATLSDELFADDIHLRIKPCFGYYVNTNVEPPELCVQRAEIACYEGYKNGNLVTEYDKALHNHIQQQKKIEHELPSACQQKSFNMAYQPIVDLKSGEVISAEALLRWKSPELGFVSPDKFIPIAEKSGLIISIGSWVLEKVITDFYQVQDKYPSISTLSMNLSAHQLIPELPGMFSKVLQKHNQPAHRFKLEITETSLLENFDVAINVVNELRDLGFHIALDDFGTGYSSLSYLHQMPVDTLKIDRSFILPLFKSDKSKALLDNIISMCHSLDIEIVAEGIEDEASSHFMRERGVQYGQGFYFSKPEFIHD